MVDYKDFTISVLNRTIDQYTSKKIELEFSEDPNPKHLETIEKELKALNRAIKEKEAERASPSNEPKSGKMSAVPGYTPLQKELQSQFRELSSFTSGCDVHVFINTLELYYRMYVENNQSDDMEQMFVRLATAKMSTDYAQTMQNYSPKVETFEAMKSYLKTHHASRMSSYQYLDTCWGLEKQESENLRNYARRIHDKMVEARNTIEAKFEAYKKDSESSIESVSMTSKDVFDMVAGQIFLQSLKLKSPRVFNHIVSDLDEVWNAADIANRAMAYQERMANEDEPAVTKPGTTLTIESKSNEDSKDKIVCRLFVTGKCKYGDKCRFIHDKGMKKLFGKQKSKSTDKNDSKVNSGGGDKGQTHAAVTLLNQDFRQ